MLEPILKETYGVIIYQEQVMQIAQVMAGFSLGEADLLRRAMGKKDKREMAKQKDRFVQGATKNKVSKPDAEYIFELVDKFAGYGFNKSHAAAYALVKATVCLFGRTIARSSSSR
jgi:DNA polymerase-3 subunit alpha